MAEDCFQLKGSVLTSIVIELNHYDPADFTRLLREKIASAPSFFSKSPVIMDVREILSTLDAGKIREMIDFCLESGLQPIGFKGVKDAAMLGSTGLALLPDDLTRDNQLSNAASTRAPATETLDEETDSGADTGILTPAPTKVRTTKFIDYPIRSGQQVYAPDANLVVLSNINRGAEVLSDGDIHVYGALRGRALAGVKGDTHARIFCQHLEAELVSIAGIFQLADNLPGHYHEQATQILLQDENLIVKSLS